MPEFSMELAIFSITALKIIIMSLCVIFARNPIHSVLFLIVAFLCASVIFLIAGAEFIALIFAIVYVGAVAILFLFTVMMFDMSFDSIKERVKGFGLFSCGFALLFVTELVAAIWVWKAHSNAFDVVSQTISQKFTNTHTLGMVLYTDYFLPFQMSGIVLLVAMVGSIALTIRSKKPMRFQNIGEQVARSPKNTLKMMNPKPGEGLLSMQRKAQKNEKESEGGNSSDHDSKSFDYDSIRNSSLSKNMYGSQMPPSHQASTKKSEDI